MGAGKPDGVPSVTRPGDRLLITGSQGSGKSRAAAEDIAAIRVPMTVWWTVPTLDKAAEQAAEYNRLRQPDSMPAIVVRGRGADDPDNPGKRMCPRYKAAERAAKAKVNVRKDICGSCPFRVGCSYLKQEENIAGMNGSGLFVMAREYLFTPCPAPSPDVFIGDESVIPTQF